MKREIALEHLARFVNIHYSWGGSTPMGGFDCSGLMVEILTAVGILPRNSDFSAAALYDRFKKNPSNPVPGALVFWGSNPINHVEMIYKLSPEPLTIGASGGGSSTRSRDDAIIQGAFIKMRPIRPNFSFIVDPFK